MSTITITNSAGRGLSMRSSDWGAGEQTTVTNKGSFFGGSYIEYHIDGNPLYDWLGITYWQSGNTVNVSYLTYGKMGSAGQPLGFLHVTNPGIKVDLQLFETNSWLKNLGKGDDLIKGNDYKDSIVAGAGNDTVKAGSGNDIVYGGTGNDTLYGNSGRDKFFFDTKPESKSNIDTIKDFSARDDSIHLERSIFTKLGLNGALKASAFWASTSGKAHDSTDRVIYDKDGGQLYYDPDGSGKALPVQFAQISKNLPVAHKDFFIV